MELLFWKAVPAVLPCGHQESLFPAVCLSVCCLLCGPPNMHCCTSYCTLWHNTHTHTHTYVDTWSDNVRVSSPSSLCFRDSSTSWFKLLGDVLQSAVSRHASLNLFCTHNFYFLSVRHENGSSQVFFSFFCSRLNHRSASEFYKLLNLSHLFLFPVKIV